MSNRIHLKVYSKFAHIPLVSLHNKLVVGVLVRTFNDTITVPDNANAKKDYLGSDSIWYVSVLVIREEYSKVIDNNRYWNRSVFARNPSYNLI